METRKLDHFIALAETKSFSEAAERLHISQSALSRSIQSLEFSLGAELFERHSRRVELSVYGNHLLSHARKAVLTIGNLQTEIDRLRAVEGGSLTVGVGPLVADTIAMEASTEFFKRHPTVKLKVIVDNLDRMTDNMQRGEIDLVIGGERTMTKKSDFSIQPLTRDYGVAVARADHPIHKQPVIDSESILAYPLATMSNVPYQHMLLFLGIDEPLAEDPIMFSSNNLQTILSITRETDAIALLLKSNAKELVDNHILKALPYQSPHGTIYSQPVLITIKDRLLSPAAEAFKQIVLELDSRIEIGDV